MKYLIASGWWSCPPKDDTREALLGENEIRDVDFHFLWRQCIDKYTNATEILIVDSASPLKPKFLQGEKWLEMFKNFGHSTNHEGNFSGYSRAIFISMMYAYSNDFDYWVYIEQDALIYGDEFIESTIASCPGSKIFYGSGKGTPQQIQQSYMIFHRDAIVSFIANYTKIIHADKIISPEWKFLFAANMLASIMPSSLLEFISNDRNSKFKNLFRKFLIRILRLFDEFSEIPIGYGRVRPINFTDPHFYFQHGSMDELNKFKSLLKQDVKLNV
jgi:hypothetical protein